MRVVMTAKTPNMKFESSVNCPESDTRILWCSQFPSQLINSKTWVK